MKRFPVLIAVLAIGSPSAFADALPPGGTVEETVETFEFQSATLGGASRAMMKVAPVGSNGKAKAGHVESAWSLRLKPAATQDSCAVDQVEIAVTSVVTRPDWVNVADLPEDARKEWSRYLTALEAYQDGHLAITTDMAGKIVERLEALPAEPSCTALEARIGETAAAVEADYGDAHADYDRETNFGKKLGAVLRKQFNRRG